MSENNKFSCNCGLNKVQRIVGGKWKLSLLWYISEETRRFGEIKRLRNFGMEKKLKARKL